MRNLILLLLLSGFLIATAFAQKPDIIEKNKALAKRWCEEIWSKGNIEVVDELIAEEFVFTYPVPGTPANKEGYKQSVKMFTTAIIPTNPTTDDIIAEGNKAVVRWTYRGIHKGEYMGVPATDKEITITGISILHIKDGKIVKEWGEMDNLSMMTQLGIIPEKKEKE